LQLVPAGSRSVDPAQGEAGDEGAALARFQAERPLVAWLVLRIVQPPPEGAEVSVGDEAGQRLADEESP
jgi:hypothetical protein